MSNLLECKGIFKEFQITSFFASRNRGSVVALNNVDFTVKKGEIVGIVGESGSGKTTLAKIICDILKPDKGSVLYKSKDIKKVDTVYKDYRRNVQMVFQDPYSSLNPRLKVFSTLKDGIKLYISKDKREILRRSEELLKVVGLEREHLFRFPHEFSGGQRQRISIARALSVDPEMIVADEPVSALDVSVQANILNLFKKLNREKGKTIVLISHDLAVVSFLCHRIYVLYKGVVVETGDTMEVLRHPLHPYTKYLIESKNLKEEDYFNEDAISPCPFAKRCRYYTSLCESDIPLKEVENNHQVRCVLRS